MSQPLHSAHERRAAASRLERAGLEPALAAAVTEEIHEGESRFATADGLSEVGDRVSKVEDRLVKVEDGLVKVEGRLVKVEVDLVRLQGDLRAVEERLGGRIDVLAAEIVSMRTIFDDRFEAVDRRMDEGFKAVDRRLDEGFAALRRENRLLLLFFSTMLGLLMALFRFGVL